MIRTIIIEDEKPAVRRLEKLLGFFSDLEVVASLNSVEESVDWFQENEHPQLIFSDIVLGDGLSFDIFDKVSTKAFIIYTTAFDQYTLKAFKLNSIDYLLKPIDEDDLEIAVNKFKARNSNASNLSLDFEMIKKMLVNPVDRVFKKRFTIKVGQQLKMITIDEIECFYSENKGTYLHTFDNRNYLLDVTLEQLENELDPQNFYRVSRKFIIPMKAIKEIQIYSNSRLKVILPTYKEDEVIVSREKVAEFKSWIG